MPTRPRCQAGSPRTRAEEAALHASPLSIQIVQASRPSTGGRTVRTQQEVQRRARTLDPPGCVDPGRELEAEIVRAQRLPGQAATLQQCLQSGTRPPAQSIQTQAHHRSILRVQGHLVAHGGQGHEIQILRGIVQTAPAVQTLEQLVGHRASTELAVWILAVGPLGVDQGEGSVRHLVDVVVIADDDVHPQLTGARDLLMGAASSVDGDENADSPVARVLDQTRGHTVTVTMTIGYEGLGRRA